MKNTLKKHFKVVKWVKKVLILKKMLKQDMTVKNFAIYYDYKYLVVLCPPGHSKDRKSSVVPCYLRQQNFHYSN